jgi:hypothetical protein
MRGFRGVSVVVASLLIILLVVVSAVLIYLWISSLQFQSVTSSSHVYLGEAIKIEGAQVSDQKLVLYVRNVGGVTTNISAVYIYDSRGVMIAGGALTAPVTISPREVKTVAISLPRLSGVVMVKVVTQRGVEAYYTTFVSVAGGWWDPSWRYRAPVVINNTLNSNTLKDYQVLVTLDTQTLISQGKMRSDCGDIRVVDDAGNQLSYWIEPGTCNTRNTKIWVKVSTIPGGGTITIYIYYGNPNAASMSNGYATFDDFDDFSTNTLGNYVQIDRGWMISGGVLVSPPGGGQGFIYKPENLQRGYALRARIYFSNQPFGDSGAGFIWGTEGGSEGSVRGYIANYYYSTQYSHLRRYYGYYMWINLAPLPTGIQGWHTIEVRINATTITVVRDNAYIDAVARDTYYTTLLGIGFRQKAPNTPAVDWWALRKYSYPEPTIRVGSEEKY